MTILIVAVLARDCGSVRGAIHGELGCSLFDKIEAL